MVGLISKIKDWLIRLDDWWYYRNRKSKEEVIKLIVNKQLKPYKVDYDFVVKNPEIEGQSWFTYYTFNSEKEYNKWKKYSINLIKKNLTRNDKLAQKEFIWIDLYCGLKHNYEIKCD